LRAQPADRIGIEPQYIARARLSQSL